MDRSRSLVRMNLVLILVSAVLGFSCRFAAANTYMAFPTPKLAKMAIEGALLEMNEPLLEVVAQGSWISRINYRDPRLREFLQKASDHDMRLVFRAKNIPEAQALDVWKRFRGGLQRQLKSFVDMGLLTEEELVLVKQSINIYPPEELLKGVKNAEDALARFNKWGIYPGLMDAGADAAEGSYGAILKFERQGYEKGARGMAFYMNKGAVRTGSVDLVHMLEEHALRTPEALSTAARHNVDSALKALEEGSMKDARKYMQRASEYTREAKNKLRVTHSSNDKALQELTDKVDDIWKRFETIESRTELFSDKIAKKTSQELAEQKALLAEFGKLQQELKRVLGEALDDTDMLQQLAKVVKEGSFMQASFMRGVLSPVGKWIKARNGLREGLSKVKDVGKRIGFLNAVAVYFTIRDLPQIYEEKGAGEATARLSLGLASLAVPEIAVAELVSLIATSVAEIAVEYVGSFGYRAVTSTQDCVDMIAGVYTVYGREAAILGEAGKKCHETNSLRDLACLVDDANNMRYNYLKKNPINPKEIPSPIKSLIECHAENASRRFDEPTQTDKKVEETLIAKCTGTVVMGWLEERELAIQKVRALADDVGRSELRAGFNPGQAVIKKDSKSTATLFSAALMPPLGDLMTTIKNEILCAGGKGSSAFVYENYTWKLDGNTVEDKGSSASREIMFDKEGQQTVCVEYEFEYGVYGTKGIGPADLGGKVQKTACVDVDITTEAPTGKMEVIIQGPKGAAAPLRAESGQQVSFEAALKNARPIEEYVFIWALPNNARADSDGPKPTRILSFATPGIYELKVEVYDSTLYWNAQLDSKAQKPVKLAEAKHTITIDPSIKDAKVEVRISGPEKIVLGNTIDLTATVTSDANVASRLKKPLWFRQYRPGPDEEEGRLEPLGEGPTLSFKPLIADNDYRFVVRIYGEGADRPVAEAQMSVQVACMDAPPGYTGWRTLDNKICKLEGADAEQKLTLKLVADRTSVKSGEKVTVEAFAGGGSSPYSWTWTGNIEGSPNDNPVVFIADSKKNTLKAEAKDGKGNTVVESITFAVDAPDAKIEGLASQVVFGATHEARLILKEGQSHLWQSSPAVTIANQESATARITFDQIGKVKIWVDIRVKKGDLYETAGSTEQVEVTVTPPDIKLVFEPPVQPVGGQVTAEVRSTPSLSDETVRYIWLAPSTTKKEQLSENKIRFKIESQQPVAIEVDLRSKRAGDTVAQIRGSFDPTGKNTSVNEIGKEDPQTTSRKKQAAEVLAKAKAAVAAGDLDTGITFAGQATQLDPTHQEAAQLNKQWTADRQTITRQITVMDQLVNMNKFNEATKELGVAQNLHAKYRPVLEAGNRLKQRFEVFQQWVREKVATAQEQLRRGDIDDAIVTSDAIAQLDEKAAAQVRGQIARECKKQGNDAVYSRDFKTAVKRLEEAVHLDPSDKEAKDRLAQAKKFSGIWSQVEQKAREFDALISEKKVWSAHKKMLEIQELQHEMPGGMANPLSKKITDDLNKALQEYNVFSQEASRKHTEYFQSQDWEAMLRNAQDMMKRELSPADDKEAKSRVEFAQQKLNEQKQVMDFYERTKSEFERGAITDLGKAVRELTQKTYVFREKDQRKKRLLDLASAIEKRQKAVNAKVYAQSFFNNGDRYYRSYDFERAIGQYAEGLRAMRENGDPSDADYAKYHKLWEDSVTKDRRFKELYNYAAGLAMTDKPLDEATLQKGISAAEDALKIRPRNGDMEIHWNKLKWKLGELQRGQKETQQAKERADRLWQEGTTLLNQGRPSEALVKFKESLRYSSNPERARYVQELEGRKAQAQRLRDEGAGFQSQGKLREAVGKYRESLKYWPDPALVDHIAKVEAEIKRQEAQVGTQPTPPVKPSDSGWIEDTYYPVDLSPVGTKRGELRRIKRVPTYDGAWVRLKSTDEKKLSILIPLPSPQLAQTLAVISNLDDATYLEQGVTIARMTVLTTSGEESFDIQAGVHSSEWNYGVGPKHKRVDDAEVGGGRAMHFFGMSKPQTVTGIRLDYVETNAPKWYGHAPGFCLGAITLIRFPRTDLPVSTPTPAPTPPSPVTVTPVPPAPTEKLEMRFQRVLSGAKTGRQYHGYQAGKVILANQKGGLLSFVFWNDQKTGFGSTLNKLNIKAGSQSHQVAQYSTSLDHSELYKDSPDWGPGGGAKVTVPIPAGVSEVLFDNQGSQTGFEISDLRFDPSGPSTGTINVSEYVNRTNKVLTEFQRVLSGAKTGRQYHGYQVGKVILANQKGGVLSMVLWNDQNKNTEKTVNRFNASIGSQRQTFNLTTARGDLVELYKDSTDWGSAGGTKIEVNIPKGVSEVTVDNQGSQTGIELSDFQFRSN